MAAVIWLHMRDHLGFRHAVGLSALLFFGLLPLAGLVLVDAASVETLRQWRRRRKLRVIRPGGDQLPNRPNR
ncbi:MAG: hypothetical protein M1294_08360 [Firmicutes bacterium]|nr:hypothetical protein [Bacillota bacterium]MCL5014219.1 hypothetical protein [Bacillota bacterium]